MSTINRPYLKANGSLQPYDGKVKKTLGKKYADFQISRYGVNAQPYYVLLDGKEQLLVQPRAYDLNADHFVEFLDEAITEFNRRK